jgi:Tfp pilus assembly protein PilO
MMQGHLRKVAILVSVAILVAKWYSAWHRRISHAEKAEGKETPGRF